MTTPIIDVRQPNLTVNSSQNSPLLALEQNPLKSINLRYPANLGTDSIYKHLMRISIYKQIQSKIGGPDIIGNGFDFKQKAGASKTKVIEGADAGAVAVAGKGAGALLSGGKPQSVQKLPSPKLIEKIAVPLVQGGISVAASIALEGNSLERKTVKEPAAYIALHMPAEIMFTDRHDFDPVSVTEALGSAGQLSSLVNGGFASGEVTGRAAELSGQFGSKITDVSLFTQGYAMNPQLEILYMGSKNREFVYQFKFAPRNESEAEELKSIIRTLRYHAAPEYAVIGGKSRSRYFTPPSEFEIEFFVGDKANRNIPRIGQCVLTNIDVNYSAAGQYSTFYDGTPVEISMQLTFTETVVLTKEDIRIGY